MTARRTVTAIVLLLTVFVFSCREKQNERLDAKAFSEKIAQPGVQILDVRAPEKFNEVHLNGAININWSGGHFGEEVRKQIDSTKTVAVYCLDGKESSDAADWLRVNGYHDVVLLDSGLFAWRQQNLPVIDVTPAPVGDTTKPVVQADTAKTTGELPAIPENFYTLIKGPKPVLVDFNATWCGPCKLLKPIVDEVVEARKNKLVFISVDTDKYPNLASTYNVTALPTLMLFRNGKAVWTQVGLVDKKTVEEGVDKH